MADFDIARIDKALAELEDALQEGLEYDQYQPILEAAREAGYKRRKEAKETVRKLAASC